ncbi:diacylglycerol/lipid kinase family protein [Deinococcus maricopensis]|uniref:Diacylglycerol kinase catalytic region n=1 Tax=Deinococcus maricopensis (strain DSM 21211 / LMG 22137 / NRRL B-23946 / LB-34) TaxID=709986 RepID=E8UA53_DEIML|nr:diacylglycerol kinase family protein [Deinococcus maricopensis]ADV67942.1 diacylglycerol kinase catalytic region [Deinococcus maricopensis DSM 21211]
MQATLIYNKRAGGSDRSDPQALVDALHAAGYVPVYRATDHEQALREALSDVQGTVFVAGGDGTIRAAAGHLIGRGLTLGVLPLGTANNIGRTLGVSGEPLDVIARYAGAQARPFDVGRVTAPWGEDFFLEAFGCGLYADVLAAYDPDEGKSPLRAAQAIVGTLGSYDPPPMKLSMDGVDYSGAYLLIEVLNTRATGPRLNLAPDADPGDGLLNVVRVNREGRDSAVAYFTALASGAFPELPSVGHLQARIVEFEWNGEHFHVDGEVRPAPEGPYPPDVPPTTVGTVRVEIMPGALNVLVPNDQREGQA